MSVLLQLTTSLAKHRPATKAGLKELGLRALPWFLSFVAVLFLMTTMLLMKSGGFTREESATVRNVDVAIPPPPEPPPPLKTRRPESPTPSIDLIGPGDGPTLDYSSNPKLAMLNLETVEQPDFDIDSLDFRETISVDFPLLEVKELDRVPKLVSTKYPSFPKELSKRGINTVITTVEIIIDQNGTAFVKKIVDPVYPEMIEAIRRTINDSRFTVPTKDGKPVQAVYLYRLKFINLIM